MSLNLTDRTRFTMYHKVWFLSLMNRILKYKYFVIIQISSQSPPNSEALLPDTLSPECSSLMLLEKNNLCHKATTQSKDEPLIIQPRILGGYRRNIFRVGKKNKLNKTMFDCWLSMTPPKSNLTLQRFYRVNIICQIFNIFNRKQSAVWRAIDSKQQFYISIILLW